MAALQLRVLYIKKDHLGWLIHLKDLESAILYKRLDSDGLFVKSILLLVMLHYFEYSWATAEKCILLLNSA